MAVLDPSTTIVSRMRSGMSVCPRVSESMTKPRARNRLTTRLNANGLFSIVATSVCLKGDNLRKRCTGDDHREDVLGGIDQELDEGGARLGHGAADRFRDARRILHLDGWNTVRLCQLHEIGRS